ncbi:MAG: tetratricopeptide repeat protein [Asgard group archaeon]|nr:tetratricopeptide repeat protein [Asgard group archaeon]
MILSVRSSEVIDKIEKLIYVGNYNQALNELNNVIDNTEENNIKKYQFLILKCKILVKRSNYTDCIKIVDEILYDEIIESNLNLKIEFLLLKSHSLSELARFDEEYEIFTIIEELIANYNQSSDIVESWLGLLHQLKGWYFTNKTKFDEAFNHLQNSLEVFKKRKDLDNLAKTYYFLGSLYIRRGETDKSLESFQRNLEIREEIGNKYEIAYALMNIGLYYNITRRTSEAFSYFDRCVLTIEESENNQQIGNIYNIYGITYYYMGNLNKAFEFYEKALFYMQQVGNKQQVAYILSNIGGVQKLRGNIDKALQAYLHCLEIFDEINSIQNIGAKLLDIGTIYLQKGDYKKSLTFLKRGLEYRRKTGNSFFIAGSLYRLIKYYSFINNKKEAEEILKEIMEINEKEENLLINQQAKIAEALILRMDNRSRSRVKAEEILTQIVNSDIIDIDSYYDAVLNLCELLVTEIKMTGNQEVLKELYDIILKLSHTSEKQQSSWLVAEVLWIQANLKLIAWDINGAQKLLTDAQIIADEKGFNHLAKRISQEFDKTLNQADLWEQLRDKNASVVERIEISQLDDLLDKLKQQIVDIDELPVEQPVMLLLIKQSGQPIYNKNFLPEKISTDESLLSGFISTINAFFKEVFDTSGSIERIKHQDLTILLKPVESLLFCYIFRGQSYSAIQKVDEFLNILRNEKKESWIDLIKQIETTEKISVKSELILEEVINSVF